MHARTQVYLAHRAQPRLEDSLGVAHRPQVDVHMLKHLPPGVASRYLLPFTGEARPPSTPTWLSPPGWLEEGGDAVLARGH